MRTRHPLRYYRQMQGIRAGMSLVLAMELAARGSSQGDLSPERPPLTAPSRFAASAGDAGSDAAAPGAP